MKPAYHSSDREKIIADALWPIATELRMTEIADLIAMLRFERHGDLADVVATAAELYYLPDTVQLGIGGDFQLDWNGAGTKVVIDLELRPKGVVIYTRLTLEDARAGVEIDHIVFENPSESQAENTAFLAMALAQAAYRRLPEAVVTAGRNAA